MSKRLLKSGLVVSSMTLLSRVLGLVRDVVIANMIGAGAAADVFLFANRIPNFLRRLFAEGAFSQAFVPVLTEYQKDGDLSKTREFIAKVSGTLGGLVTIVTLLAMIGSPVVAAIFGTGWFLDWLNGGPDAGKYELASFLLRITFPYLWFVTLVALSGAVLNTIGQFGVAAFSPVLLNVAMIGAAIWIAPHTQYPEVGLAIGIFLGGLLQFLFQLPYMKKAGLLVKPKWAWHDPGVKKIRTLMIPALFGVSVSQINLLLDTFIASFLMTGSISYLYYSDRLLEFPLGLFGIAIATVILPALSRRHSEKEEGETVSERFSQTMDWGVRMIFLLGIPAMFGIMVLAKPMMMVLFMRGEFTFADVNAASLSLLAFNAGLVSFMLIKVLAPGYYARQDTKTPVRYGIISMISNMGFNLLAIPFSYVGLAMASAMSGTLNAWLLYRGLAVSGVYRIQRNSAIFIGKVALAGLAMAAAVSYCMPALSLWQAQHNGMRMLWLAVLIGLAAVVYFAALLLLGVRPRHLRADTDISH
ncbi:MAG: murein biosynthesis integral membrane protein MurJ [Plesiomonas shigelloides]